MTLTFSEPAIHPEDNAIFGYDGGNHFVRKKALPRANFAASNNRFEKAEGYLGKWNLFC